MINQTLVLTLTIFINKESYILPTSFFFVKLSKEYGSVFTVYFGPKKVVVLAGYKTVEQALVNHAVEFGDREITPAFHLINQGHGNKVICNCFYQV